MDKGKLLNFINKYSLNGNCNSVKWISKSRGLLVNFITEDKSTLGMVAAKGVNFPDGEFGIYNTKVLVKLLGALQNEFEMEVNSESLMLKDESVSAIFRLANLDIIPESPSTTNLPESDFSFSVNSIFIDKFLKSKAAIEESTNFAFQNNKEGKVQLIINYAQHNTDRICIPLDIEHKIDSPLLFNAEIFKEVLSANKDCTEGKISVSAAGIMVCQFKSEDIASKYYLVMLEQ